MYTGFAVSVPPATEPLTLATVKQHLRVDSTADDTLIPLYITAARQWAERYQGRAYVQQTLVWTLGRQPGPLSDGGDEQINSLPAAWPFINLSTTSTLANLKRGIELPRAPVQSVSSVLVRDANFTDTTLDPVGGPNGAGPNYRLDTDLEPGRLRIDWNQVALEFPAIAWPLEHIKTTFIAGYAAGAVADDPAGSPDADRARL